MELILHLWHVLVLALSAWIDREQEKAIEYLQTENQIVREETWQGPHPFQRRPAAKA